MDVKRLTQQAALEFSLGLNCKKKMFDGDTTKDSTNVFHTIHVLTNTIFVELKESLTLTDTWTDLAAAELSGITVPAGTVMYGYFTNIDLTSGVIRAHSISELV